MAVNTNKGGRGKKAEHPTTVIRIPIALESLVQTISDDYKLTGQIPTVETCTSLNKPISLDESTELSKIVARLSKKSKADLSQWLLKNYDLVITID